MTLTIGSVCTGTGALDQAVAEVLGDARVVWTADPDPAVSTLLEHHHPDVPNLGDLAAVDWAGVEPVDVFSAGFPCQDVSTAGRRAGLRTGTRTGLWLHIIDIIDLLRPRLVVLENVRGLLNADAGSPMEPCPWCVGDESATGLRALGAVLGDLADIGYDAVWCVIPASDVGAPHRRERVFVLAAPAAADTGCVGVQRRPVDRGVPRPEGSGDRQGVQRERRGDPAGDGGAVAADTEPEGAAPGRRGVRPGPADGGHRVVADPDGVEGGASDAVDQFTGGGCSPAGRRDPEHGGRGAEQPATRRGGAAAHTEGDGRGERRPQPARIVRGSDAALGGHADAPDADGWRLGGSPELDGEPVGPGQRAPLGYDAERLGPGTWGDYWPAVERWERILGRPAPSPTVLGARGKRQLSPEFVEWMQGLQPGHVTGVPGLSRKAMLKILGNGVVPQQAAAAIRYLLPLLLAVPAPSAVGVCS